MQGNDEQIQQILLLCPHRSNVLRTRVRAKDRIRFAIVFTDARSRESESRLHPRDTLRLKQARKVLDLRGALTFPWAAQS